MCRRRDETTSNRLLNFRRARLTDMNTRVTDERYDEKESDTDGGGRQNW
jgi:hypothetical protein